MVKIHFDNGLTATVEHGVWTCEDPVLLDFLKSVRAPGSITGVEPRPDRSLAEAALGYFPGTIVAETPRAEPPTGKVYF